MKTNLTNKKIALLGMGIEGMASARFLHKMGAKLWVLDSRQKDKFDQKVVAELEEMKAEFVVGDAYLENLTNYDMIVRSPGFYRLHPALVEAEKQGVEISSQTKLFFDYCPCPIIGVTGTKGKGTTSTLIYEMLKADGRDVYLGGNIGVPSLSFFDDLKKTSWVVLELSSFQLQDLHKSPHIAVMLMITSEHLNVHKDLEEYIDSKRNLVRFQTKDDFTILNRDYPATHESDIYSEGQILQVSREREVEEGCFVRDDAVWYRFDGTEKKVVDTDKIRLLGKHNQENVCAAVMAATVAGVSRENIYDVVTSFTGLEHRLELVKEVNGVKYYNDSFSTNPETAIAAIQSFSAPEILLFGGASKSSDFKELGRVIREAKNIRAIISLGDEWEKIKAEVLVKNQEAKILLIEGAETMHQVVQAASKIAQPGDVVLLSPACTSFNWYKSYKERGADFKQEVHKL